MNKPTMPTFGEVLKLVLECSGLLSLIENEQERKRLQSRLNSTLYDFDVSNCEEVITRISELLREVIKDDALVGVFMYSINNLLFDKYPRMFLDETCTSGRAESLKFMITSFIKDCVISIHYAQFVYRPSQSIYEHKNDMFWFLPEIHGDEWITPTSGILKHWQGSLPIEDAAAMLDVSEGSITNWRDGTSKIRAGTLKSISQNATLPEKDELVTALFICEMVNNLFKAIQEDLGSEFCKECIATFKKLYKSFYSDYSEYLARIKCELRSMHDQEWYGGYAADIFNELNVRIIDNEFNKLIRLLGANLSRESIALIQESDSPEFVKELVILFINTQKYAPLTSQDFQLQVSKIMTLFRFWNVNPLIMAEELEGEFNKLLKYRTSGKVHMNESGDSIAETSNEKFFSYFEPFIRAKVGILKNRDLESAQQLYMQAVRSGQFSAGEIFEQILIEAKLSTIYLLKYHEGGRNKKKPELRNKTKPELKNDDKLLNEWCRIVRKAEPFLAEGDEEWFQEVWNSKYEIALAMFDQCLNSKESNYRDIRLPWHDSEFMKLIKDTDEKRAIVELKNNPVDINWRNSSGEHAFTIAVKLRYFELAMKILKVKKRNNTPKIDVSVLDAHSKVGGETALSLAIDHYQVKLVKELLKLNVNVNVPFCTPPGILPLDYTFILISQHVNGGNSAVSIKELIDIVELLLEKEAQLQKTDSLKNSFRFHRPSAAKFLLFAKANGLSLLGDVLHRYGVEST